MTLDPSAELLLEAVETAGLPRIETLDAPTARSLFDGRVAVAVADIESIVHRTIPGPAGEIPVRVYRDRPNGEPCPIVLHIHGGGWVINTLDDYDGVCTLLAKLTGAVVVSVDYRLAPEHRYPAAVDDSEAAARWVIANADEIGGDPSRLAVMGDSAGGNLSAAVAQTLRDEGTPLRAQVLVYPATDNTLTDSESYIENGDGYILTNAAMVWFLGHYAPDESRRSEPRCSPMLGNLEGLAPAFVLNAGYDPLRDDGRAYTKALRAAGVDVVEVEYPGQVHSFFRYVGLMPESKDAIEKVAEFLATRL